MLLSTWQRYELEMKQTRQFGYLAENRLVVWRSFVWLFGESLMKLGRFSKEFEAKKERFSKCGVLFCFGIGRNIASRFCQECRPSPGRSIPLRWKPKDIPSS
jgi:hypothetical protein